MNERCAPRGNGKACGLTSRHNFTADNLKSVCLSRRAMILESVITCPHCTTAKSETMPTNACQFFYTFSGCGATLRPELGDCCVFCSYGSVRGRAFGWCCLLL
jgi:hypothetical protein